MREGMRPALLCFIVMCVVLWFITSNVTEWNNKLYCVMTMIIISTLVNIGAILACAADKARGREIPVSPLVTTGVMVLEFILFGVAYAVPDIMEQFITFPAVFAVVIVFLVFVWKNMVAHQNPQ